VSPVELTVGELHARAGLDSDDPGVMRLTLVGTADATVEAALNELLGRLHSDSQRARAREVAVDLRKLEFMNSSCFKSFITWIVAVRRLAEDQTYRIRFLANAGLHWQKRSLHAISYFGGDLVSVENA
jgi:hypothetical protein